MENPNSLSLIEKLACIRDIADVIKKDKKGYNYTYADITSILAKITAGMKKYKVSLIPSLVPGTFSIGDVSYTSSATDRSGKKIEKYTRELLVNAEMVFKWVNNEDTNDTISIPWTLVGSQSDPSQAFGSALTYCTRYFLTSYFQIAQSDLDVDAYRSKQKAATDAENKAILEGIIGEIDTLVKCYFTDHPESGDKDEVRTFISNYAKDGNYYKIKEPEIAGKLLTDFKEKFLGGK